ncbi:MAG: nitroreductase family protein [Candidatus Omnitrophota bacterium]
MNLKTLVKRARSYRRFDEKHRISKKILKELVELARFSPCAMNQQALKFKLINTKEQNDLIFPALSWAGYIKGWGGPKKGERPSAYIIILGDTRISQKFWCDHGIAGQSMLLGAVEKGLGGCMLGAINRELVTKNLKISKRYEILLVIALGKPKEKIVLETLKKGKDTKYYRDKNDVHHVPKRPLSELIV